MQASFSKVYVLTQYIYIKDSSEYFWPLCYNKKIMMFENITAILLFLEFLASNTVSHRVVSKCVSAFKFAFTSHGWDTEVFSHPLVTRLLKGISLTVQNPPSPKGLFSFYQVFEISSLRDLFESLLTYRSAFLLGFYGLLRILYVAPASRGTVDSARQLLREYVKFTFPGVHIRIKWAKNLQNPEQYMW